MLEKIETLGENDTPDPLPLEEAAKCYYDSEEKLLQSRETKGKLSYWKNPGTEPLKNMTVGDLTFQAAEKYRDRHAVCVHLGSRLTYKEVHNQAESFAAGLLAVGLKKGDFVGIWAPNTLEWYISILGIIKAGMIAVNLNPLYECPELESATVKADVKALIIGDTLNERNYYEMMNKIIPELSNYNSGDRINSEVLPLLKILIVMTQNYRNGAYRWCDLLTLPTNYHRQKLLQIQKEINVHDICNIQFTSGTTGATKGAALTHHNLVNNSYFVGKRMLLMNKHHKICLQVPLFHTFGTVLGMFVAINYGATIVLPSLKFSPTKSIEAVIKEKCTVLYGTPTMYIDLMTIVNRMAITDPAVFSKLSSLEVALTAGSNCAPELFRKMKKIFNFKRIYSGYGMTEVSPIAFLSSPSDSEWLVTSTIGNVIDHAEVKVIDGDGRIVPFGTAGEVCFRGYNVMKGYYNDPQTTEKAFLEGGWIRSGDKFVLLDNGYGQVVGRIKDTIIRGGENIEPAEIENVIITHADVSHVQVYAVSDDRLGEVVAASIVKHENSTLNEENIRKFCEGKGTTDATKGAALTHHNNVINNSYFVGKMMWLINRVYAVSDDRLGEVVAASIVKHENSTLNEENIRKFCEGKFAAYKIPVYIKFVDDFPRTATRKIQKFKLRENLERELALS